MKSKKEYSKRLCLYPGFFRLLSLQNPFFIWVRHHLLPKNFVTKGKLSIHKRSRLWTGWVTEKQSSSGGTATEPSWKFLKSCCLLTPIRWQGLVWGFLVFKPNVQHVTSILQHSISGFSSIISTCYFKEGWQKQHTSILSFMSDTAAACNPYGNVQHGQGTACE